MKKGWILGLLIVFQSCGMMMITDQPGSITPLAISSGGYLSTDDYNEISPFVFRYQNTNYLFFSSDRAGSYDIYYAIINSDGTFESPVMLPASINTSNKDEIYPVLYNGFGLVLSFIRASSGSSNVINLMGWNFGFTNFGTYSGMPLTNSTGLGLLKNNLIVAYGNSDFSLFDLSQSTGASPVKTNFSAPAYSANSITIPLAKNNSYSVLYIKDALAGGKHQITIEGSARIISNFYVPGIGTNWITNSIASVIPAESFTSEYDDISPFIDFENGYKIYFASDRYGNGNYDLYRYNTTTVDSLPEVSSLLQWDKNGPSLSIFSPTNGSVFGNGSKTISVNVSEPISESGVYAVFCALDSGNFLKMTYMFTNWQLGMYFDAGIHTISVYALDELGNCSETNKSTVEVFII